MMGDISIDVPQVCWSIQDFLFLSILFLYFLPIPPQAYLVLERWVVRCRQAGVINDEVVRKVRSSLVLIFLVLIILIKIIVYEIVICFHAKSRTS